MIACNKKFNIDFLKSQDEQSHVITIKMDQVFLLFFRFFKKMREKEKQKRIILFILSLP